MSEQIPRVAVLASGDRASGGGGSTVERFARDILEGNVQLDLGVVICNNPPGTVGVYERVEGLNKKFGLTGDDRIDVVTIGPGTHPGGRQERGQTLEESAAVCRTLEERGIDFATMLGYMRILTGKFVEEWGWKQEYAQDEQFGYRQGIYHPNARISNNHPSILPFTADTHGLGAHQLAMELHRAGRLQRTAMTWHLASAQVDDGPVIDEMPLEITPGDDADSLGDRVQDVEKEYTARIIEKHLQLRAEHARAHAS